MTAEEVRHHIVLGAEPDWREDGGVPGHGNPPQLAGLRRELLTQCPALFADVGSCCPRVDVDADSVPGPRQAQRFLDSADF